jgi:anti-sigma factor RsiW
MPCERAAQVQAYHDGRLTAQGRAEVEDHLRDCGPCAALLAELRGLSRLIAAAPRARISDQAMLRLRQSYRAAADRSILRISSWLTAAAAAVLVGALRVRPAADRSDANQVQIASAAWQTQAVMPPSPDARDGSAAGSDVVMLAQWMADEFEPADAGGR